MNRQLLRDSKVVINFEERAYVLSALSQISGGTSIGEVSQKRKTLFSNTPKQHSTTARVNPSTVSLQLNVTDTATEQLFFRLVGLEVSDDTNRLYLPNSVSPNTQVFSMYIINSGGSVVRSDNNFVESIDFTLARTGFLVLNISISSAKLETVSNSPSTTTGLNQGAIRVPTPVSFLLDNELVSNMTSASISLQQSAEWTDTKSLFNTFGREEEVYSNSKATTSDITLSATIQANYLNKTEDIGKATNKNIVLEKSGIVLSIDNARIVSNLDIQSIYKNRLDVSISEDTGITYFYFGE